MVVVAVSVEMVVAVASCLVVAVVVAQQYPPVVAWEYCYSSLLLTKQVVWVRNRLELAYAVSFCLLFLS